MKTSQINQTAKMVRRLKLWSLPLGGLFIVIGWVIFSNWGMSWHQSQIDWYTVHSKKINIVGIVGLLLLFVGIAFLVTWFFLWLILKVTIPCPKCKGLLAQRTPICPHCKTKLDWGDVEIRYCASCGTKAQDRDICCRNCGTKL